MINTLTKPKKNWLPWTVMILAIIIVIVISIFLFNNSLTAAYGPWGNFMPVFLIYLFIFSILASVILFIVSIIKGKGILYYNLIGIILNIVLILYFYFLRVTFTTYIP